LTEILCNTTSVNGSPLNIPLESTQYPNIPIPPYSAGIPPWNTLQNPWNTHPKITKILQNPQNTPLECSKILEIPSSLKKILHWNTPQKIPPEIP
jgi:hypothetical protein